jgi:amidase
MGNKVNAFSNDSIGTNDAVGIAALIKSGEISAQEAIDAAIKRAEAVNGQINAIAIKTYERAQNQVKELNDGALSGVPTFVKDNIPVKGVPSQSGTLAFKAKPAKKNSKFVEQFNATGLITLGKSTLPEFGLICSAENPNWGITRNPWNTDYTTGGSSSGSAALVASGVVPIASANDGAGSTRIPAACCGLVGLKPTRNRLVNPDGSELLPINIGYEGVLTRSVRDTAAFYAAAEKYYKNPTLPEMGMVEHPAAKRLRIAFFENIPIGKIGHQDTETRNTLISTANLLATLGHTVEEIPFPITIEDYTNDFLNYYGFLSFIQRDLGRVLFQAKVDKAKLEPFTHGLSSQFKRNLFKLPNSLKRLRKMGEDFEQYFKTYDIILTPVLAHTTPQIGHFSIELNYDEVSQRAVAFAPFTGLQNITGAPALSLPLGRTTEGMPIGMQFVADYGHDKRLLELAYEIETSQPWKFIYEA